MYDKLLKLNEDERRGLQLSERDKKEIGHYLDSIKVKIYKNPDVTLPALYYNHPNLLAMIIHFSGFEVGSNRDIEGEGETVRLYSIVDASIPQTKITIKKAEDFIKSLLLFYYKHKNPNRYRLIPARHDIYVRLVLAQIDVNIREQKYSTIPGSMKNPLHKILFVAQELLSFKETFKGRKIILQSNLEKLLHLLKLVTLHRTNVTHDVYLWEFIEKHLEIRKTTDQSDYTLSMIDTTNEENFHRQLVALCAAYHIASYYIDSQAGKLTKDKEQINPTVSRHQQIQGKIMDMLISPPLRDLVIQYGLRAIVEKHFNFKYDLETRLSSLFIEDRNPGAGADAGLSSDEATQQTSPPSAKAEGQAPRQIKRQA